MNSRPLLAAALLTAAGLVAAACATQPGPPTQPPASAPAVAPDAAPAAPPASAGWAKPAVVTDATLPRSPLAQFSNGLVAGSVADDHGIALGGTGSDIYPAQAPDEYWMVTDRGPNGQVKVDGDKRRTFPVPGFDPAILRVKVDGSTLRVQQSIPLTTTAGRPITGLSNIAGRDETPYDLTAGTQLPVNPSGVDSEGLVRAANGEFWVSEEYSPSILRISPTGTVLARYVPQGLALPGADYPVNPTLPAILGKRQINRGFESLAMSPDGHTLYTMLQSPLALPNPDAGAESRAVRLIAFDTATGKATAEYVYSLEDVTGFDQGADGDESDMKISALAWYGPDQLLVDERTDDVAKLFVARLGGATNVLGGPFDDPAHSPPLEQADLRAASVTPLAKTLLVDLTASVPNLPKKIEGVAVRDDHTIAVANDNDFGMTEGKHAFGSDGRVADSGTPSTLMLLRAGPK
ncbi:MAG TPA: esterase-like activity of phytase family protein [Pseudonocardia sp.]|uniref:esterase-like activity of phytase family protein n=1 Tax=Pseudonocardia sp. TaxID=60912 RepID=UPI002ED94E81